jgi:beta-glucosidase
VSLIKLSSKDFGNDFMWGVAMAAAQNEGATATGGRSPSIWDDFAKSRGKIKDGSSPHTGNDFYHRYQQDLSIAQFLGFKVFRFSVSWSRILPLGIGDINLDGIAFYNRIIDECLALGLTPMITLYHWDLPACLEAKGGWTSPLMPKWFERFATVCAQSFGGRVKHWIVLNEPFGFVSLGYMLGQHAPGRIGLSNFFPALHNACLAQADGGRILRMYVNDAVIGTSFSCSSIIPYTNKQEDVEAAKRVDALLNRLMVEPVLGLGYPRGDKFKFLEKLYFQTNAWRYDRRMQFDFDFIGIQYYFPIIIRHNSLVPFIQASEVKAKQRNVPRTALGWEVNPDGLYEMLKKFNAYESIKSIIITENGACYKDSLVNGAINDRERISYFQHHLSAVLRAKKEGMKVDGYLAWTLTDNFEWAEGYKARFGLVHVDFDTQERTLKKSAHWWRSFLQATVPSPTSSISKIFSR